MTNVFRFGLVTVMAAWASFSALADPAKSLSCIEHSSHQGITFFLVDRSDKLKDVSSLRQTIGSVKERIGPGQRVVVATSSGKKSDTHVVLDLVRPKQSMWDSALKIRAQEKRLGDCWKAIEDQLATQNEESPTSAILETLGFAADILKAEADGPKHLILFSDMVQHSEALNLYTPKIVDVSGSFAKIEKLNLIPVLQGVTVDVAGVGANVTDEKARQLEKFWRQVFQKSGAEVRFFGPMLLGN